MSRMHEYAVILFVAAGCSSPGTAEFELKTVAPVVGNGNETSPLMIADGGILNQHLANPGVIVMAGLGLTGGGPVALGDTTSVSIAKGGVSNEMLAKPSLTIDTAAPLSGGGSVALGGSLALSLPVASGMADGYLSKDDWARFDAVTRMPPPGGSSYIQNGVAPQTASFNVTGAGAIGGGLLLGGGGGQYTLRIIEKQDDLTGVAIYNGSLSKNAMTGLLLTSPSLSDPNAGLMIRRYSGAYAGKSDAGSPLAGAVHFSFTYASAPFIFNPSLPGSTEGDYRFEIGSKEAVRIANNGNVGIGTTVPDTLNGKPSQLGRIVNVTNQGGPSSLVLQGSYVDVDLIASNGLANNHWMIIRTEDNATSFLPHNDAGSIKYVALSISHDTGNIGIALPRGTPASTALDVNGTITYNALQLRSSRTSKDRIRELDRAEAERALQELRPSRFYYKADYAEERLGFIAEDVPDLVAMNDRKSLDPMEFAALLTKVVQEQQKQIAAEQQRNTKLEQLLMDQQRRIERLEAALAKSHH